jgi:hypothetical protein
MSGLKAFENGQITVGNLIPRKKIMTYSGYRVSLDLLKMRPGVLSSLPSLSFSARQSTPYQVRYSCPK